LVALENEIEFENEQNNIGSQSPICGITPHTGPQGSPFFFKGLGLGIPWTFAIKWQDKLINNRHKLSSSIYTIKI
jgi:hypothetical protein